MKEKFQPNIDELADISVKLAVRLSEDKETQKLFMKYTEKLTIFCVEYVQEMCKDTINFIDLPKGNPDGSIKSVPAVNVKKV